MKTTRTIQVSEDNAKIFQSSFTKKGVVKKQIDKFFHKSQIEYKGELTSVEIFSEAGEGGFETTEEKVYMCINW